MTKFNKADIIDENWQKLLDFQLKTEKFLVVFNTKQDKTPIIDWYLLLRDPIKMEYWSTFLFQLKSHEKIDTTNSYLVSKDIITWFKDIKSPCILFITDNSKNLLYWIFIEDILKWKENTKSYNIWKLDDYLINDIDIFFNKLKQFNYIWFYEVILWNIVDTESIKDIELNILKEEINKWKFDWNIDKLLNYINKNNKDLDIAYNLLWVMYFNWYKNYEKAEEYFSKSIKINSSNIKAKINLLKTFYNLYILSNNKEYLDKSFNLSIELLENKDEFNDKIWVLEIYWSILLIKNEKDKLEKYFDIINLDKYKSEFIFDNLYKIYQRLSNEDKVKETISKWLKKFPKSYFLKLWKINLELDELNTKLVLYNYEIIPKLNQSQYNTLKKILDNFYSLLDDIDKSSELDKIKNLRKFQIWILSYQLKVNNESKYIKLFNLIDFRLIDDYYLWQLDLIKINESIENRNFEVAYNILQESKSKEKIPFSEIIRLAWIFIYNWDWYYSYEILESSISCKDFNNNNIDYWKYKVDSNILLWNEELAKSILNEAKVIFKNTQYFNEILKYELWIWFRNIDNKDDNDFFVKSMLEYHKMNWDSEVCRMVKEEDLEKFILKNNIKDKKETIKDLYIKSYLPHYCLEESYWDYIDLIEKREALLPIKYWYLNSSTNDEMINKSINWYKYIIDYFSLYNLEKLWLLDYYQLKNILQNKEWKFELSIDKTLFFKIRDDKFKKNHNTINNIFNFVKDKKIKHIDFDWKLSSILPWVKKTDYKNQKTYKIIPKWLINSINYAKNNWIILISDDTSNLETKNIYWIEAISSFIILWKMLKKPLLNLNKSKFIMLLWENNYTFISFNSDDLKYIFENDDWNKNITLYNKYNLNSSFFYLCNQIIINPTSNYYSFFKVFYEFSLKIDSLNIEKIRIYLILFFYIFSEFYKNFIFLMVNNRNNKELFLELNKDLNTYIELSTHTIANIINKLDEINIKEILLDIEYIGEKDKDIKLLFWVDFINSIKKVILHKFNNI